ncbi:MAG TPA: hypothetical protein VMJ52_01060 [Xanthobacteraceae bacterium]|nr:hypothetical protein [Xanthobacteraceae bacterium]
MGKGNNLSTLLAAASLLSVSVGYVGAATSPLAAEGANDSSGSDMTGHDLRLAAQSPKVSTPQVHVNTGTHVNTTAVNASKISHIKAMPGSNSLKRDNF